MKFNIVSGKQSNPSETTHDSQEQVLQMIKENKVFLFMKGSPAAPQCGFSSRVCDILKKWNIPFQSFNVLSDENVRTAIKEFSNWPTIPQLYVNHEFIGGCDIIEELSASGELEDVLKKAYPDYQFKRPPAPATTEPISPIDANQLLKHHPEALLLDIRSPEEWEIVHLEGSQLLTQELLDSLLQEENLDQPLLFICHHGMRSADAARFFASEGFQKIYNITGGIDRWAVEVDPSLPRY